MVKNRCIKILSNLNCKVNPAALEKAAEIALVFGIIGGRIWHLVNRYLHYGIPMHVEAFEIWKGGMAFQGGLLFGILAPVIYLLCSGYEKELPKICDAALSQLPLAIIAGRMGNFMNEEFMNPVPIGELMVDYFWVPVDLQEAVERFEVPLCIFAALTEGLLLFIITNYWINQQECSANEEQAADQNSQAHNERWSEMEWKTADEELTGSKADEKSVYASGSNIRLTSKTPKNYVPYQTSLVFLFGYGSMRFLNDYFREELVVGRLKLSEYVCIGLVIFAGFMLLIQFFLNKTK